MLLYKKLLLMTFGTTLVQCMILLTESKEVLSQEIKCLCNKNITILVERTVLKSMDVSYIFIALEIYGIEMDVYCIDMYAYCIEMHIYCIQSTYIL